MNSLGGSAARASDSGSMPSAVLYVPAEEPEYILMLREGINRTPLPDSVLRIVAEYAEYQIVGDMNALSLANAKYSAHESQPSLSDKWSVSMERLQHSAFLRADPSLCTQLIRLTDWATDTWLKGAWIMTTYRWDCPNDLATIVTKRRLGEWRRWNSEIMQLGPRFPADVQLDVHAVQDAASGMCRLAICELTCQELDGEPLWTKLRASLRNADRVIDLLADAVARQFDSSDASLSVELLDRMKVAFRDALKVTRANCMALSRLMGGEVRPDIECMARLAEPSALNQLNKLIDEFMGTPARYTSTRGIEFAMKSAVWGMGSLLAAPIFIVDALYPPDPSCDASAVERAARGGLTEQELQVVRQAMQVHHREVARGDFDGLLNAVRGELQPGSLDMLSTLLPRPGFQASVAREFESSPRDPVAEDAEPRVVVDMNALSIEAAKRPPYGLQRSLSDKWSVSMERLQHSASLGADPGLGRQLARLTDWATNTWVKEAWSRTTRRVGRATGFAADITRLRLGEWWRWNSGIRQLGPRFPPEVQPDVHAVQDAASGMCRLVVYELTCQGLDGEPLWAKLRALLGEPDPVIAQFAAEFMHSIKYSGFSPSAEVLERVQLTLDDAVRATRSNCMTLAALMEGEVQPDIGYMALLAEPNDLEEVHKLVNEFKRAASSEYAAGTFEMRVRAPVSGMSSLLAAPIFILEALIPPDPPRDASATGSGQ